jgi:hypothetical protein
MTRDAFSYIIRDARENGTFSWADWLHLARYFLYFLEVLLSRPLPSNCQIKCDRHYCVRIHSIVSYTNVFVWWVAWHDHDLRRVDCTYGWSICYSWVQRLWRCSLGVYRFILIVCCHTLCAVMTSGRACFAGFRAGLVPYKVELSS